MDIYGQTATPDPVPLGALGLPYPGMTDGGGMIRNPGPAYPPVGGIHWFGPGGSGVAYPGPVHFPFPHPGVPINPGPPFHGVPRPGIHPAIAHAAARRAAVRALNLRRRLF